MALGLAVYASPGESPHSGARLASRCWSDSPGRAFHPQDSYERFPICFLHLVLLSQASLGASLFSVAHDFTSEISMGPRYSPCGTNPRPLRTPSGGAPRPTARSDCRTIHHDGTCNETWRYSRKITCFGRCGKGESDMDRATGHPTGGWTRIRSTPGLAPWQYWFEPP